MTVDESFNQNDRFCGNLLPIKEITFNVSLAEVYTWPHENPLTIIINKIHKTYRKLYYLFKTKPKNQQTACDELQNSLQEQHKFTN